MVTTEKLGIGELARLLGAWSSTSGPLYVQLAVALDRLIKDGQLRDGVVLPSERKFAAALSISRSTVARAYDRLEERRRIEKRPGSGTWVTVEEIPGPEHRNSRVGHFFVPTSQPGALVQASLRCSLDIRSELQELAATIGRVPNSDVTGLPELREIIASRFVRGGLPTTSDEILITTGCQHGVTLLVSTLLKAGDVAIVEEPTWPGIVDVIERAGARPVGVRVDAGGIDTDHLREDVDRLRPSAVVVNPHHQNPTMSRLLPHRRRELAEISADYNVPLIEDRVLAPLAFDGTVPPPLASLRPDAPIVTIDSFSKTIWQGFGVGWIRCSRDLIGRLTLEKAMGDLGTAVMPQLLACQLAGRLDGFIEDRAKALRKRAQWARGLLEAAVPEWSFEMPKGGTSFWCRLPSPRATGFARHTARSDLILVTEKAFSVEHNQDQHIRIPFTAEEAAFTRAVDVLAESWASFGSEQGVPSEIADRR